LSLHKRKGCLNRFFGKKERAACRRKKKKTEDLLKKRKTKRLRPFAARERGQKGEPEPGLTKSTSKTRGKFLRKKKAPLSGEGTIGELSPTRENPVFGGKKKKRKKESRERNLGQGEKMMPPGGVLCKEKQKSLPQESRGKAQLPNARGGKKGGKGGGKGAPVEGNKKKTHIGKPL